jgi:hypothetical protein
MATTPLLWRHMLVTGNYRTSSGMCRCHPKNLRTSDGMIEISAYAVNRKAALKIGKPKNIRLGHFFRYGINGVFHAGGITAKIPPA